EDPPPRLSPHDPSPCPSATLRSDSEALRCTSAGAQESRGSTAEEWTAGSPAARPGRPPDARTRALPCAVAPPAAAGPQTAASGKRTGSRQPPQGCLQNQD